MRRAYELLISMRDSTGGSRMRRSIAVRNRRDSDIVIVLEPWANEYVLKPNEVLTVVEEGGESGTELELGVESSSLVFYARAGSILRAYQGDRELP